MFNRIFIIFIALSPVSRALAATISPQLQIFSSKGDPIAFLAEWLYPTMIAAVTILAIFRIIYAGFKWMAGAVSPPVIADAKDKISVALWGLGLALLGWLILNTINPDLIQFKTPTPIEDTGSYLCNFDSQPYTGFDNCRKHCGDITGVGTCTPIAP